MDARTALVEIDFQRWVLEATASDGVVAAGREVRDRWRAGGAAVVVTRYLSDDPEDPERHDVDGAGAAFVPELRPEPGDLVLSKSTRDITDNPDLRTNLDLAGVEHVVLTGVATEHGVRLAALSLHRLGYRVTVEASACAGVTRAEHDAALVELAGAGITVV